MKVLQLGKFYPIRGGVEKVMHDLLLGLSETGVYCDMLCASTEDYPAGTIKVNEYANIIVEPTSIRAASTMLAPQMVVTLRKICKQYDVIHIHHPDPMACLALFCSGYKGKVVLHWHSDILKQKVLLKLYKPLQSWLIKRADLLIGTTPTYVQKSPFLRKVQHKVLYVPIGVEPIQINETKSQEIRNRYPGKRLIFSLGRLVEYKGYEYLIRSAQYLDKDIHILIGGKGPLMIPLQQLIQALGVQDKVTLLGFIKDEDLSAYFGAMEVFCLSSIYKTEAFGIVQIEAMSCGKPVVSAHIPGSGVSWVNAHEQSGIVVPRENPEALADAFRKIFSCNELRQNLSEGARSRYVRLFSKHSMINQTLDLYHTLLHPSDNNEVSIPLSTVRPSHGNS